jgi:hypothetical protein
MANFPASPISGQVFTSSDLTNWVWDGSSWKVTNYGLIKLPVSQNSGSVIQSNTINFINTSTVTVNVDQSDANTANIAFNVILGDLLHAQEDEIIFSGPVTTTGSPNLTYNLASNTMRVGGDLFVANVSTDNVSVNGNITFTNARVSIANVLNVGTLFTANSANGNINVGASNVYITSGNLYFGTLIDANNANGNVAITGNLSATRTFNVGSLLTANTGNGNINIATSNVYIAGGNVLMGTLFNANVANGNLTITGNLSTTTTFNVGSLLTANTGNGNINIATSNVYIAGGNLYVGTLINSNTANGNVAITGNLSATRTFNVGSLLTANTGNGNINIATSNVHIAGGNLYIGTFLSSNSANANVNVTGNIYSSNLYVGSLVAANSANANVAISGNLIITKNFTSADLTATGNLYVGELLVANDANGNVVITGNLSATKTFNVGSLLTANTGNGNINIATSNVHIAGGNVHIGSLFNANVANGNVAITGNLSATRTFNVGSLLTANTGNTNVNIATGNVHIAGGNLYIGTLFNANTANGNVSVVGNVLSTNVTASTLLNVGSLFIANTTNGNINVATSNVYVAGGNVHFGTLLNANVANANLAITGNLSVTRTFNVGSHFTANSGNTNVNIATGNVYIAGGNLYIGTLFNANTANGNVSIAGNVLSVNVTATTLLNVADLFTANVANDNINIGTGNVYTTGPNFNVSSGNLFIGSIFVANTANANVGVTGNLSVTRTFNVSSHLTANAGNTNINIATGNVHIAGGNLYIGNLFNANTANGNVSVVGNVLSTNVTASTLLNVGTLFIANTSNGNINVATSNVYIAGGNVHIGTLFNANVANANLAITGNLSVTRTFNVGSHLTANSVNTNINIATGNVHIAGGNLYISAYLTANSANANLHVVGNVYTVGNVYATSNVYSERFTDITSSTYYIEPSSVALSAVLAGNAHFGKAEGDSHVKVGTSAGGGYTAYFGASQTDATFPSGIKYGAYFAYDSYWDGTNWNADRTTLGRKWLVEMGYHTGQFKVRYFDGTVSSPWADSAWSDYLVVDRVAGNVGISTASPTSKLYVSGNATITSGLHIGAVDILPTLNVAANTVKVAANGGSILAEQEINFINTASIQVSVAAGAGAAAGNANVGFTVIESGTSIPDIKTALSTHNTTFGTLNTTSATTNTTFGTLNTTSATTNTTFGTLNTTFATTNTTFGTINTNISNANTYASTLANAAANTVRVYANGGSIVNDSYLNFSNSYTTLVTVAAGAGATFSGNANVEFQSNSTYDLAGTGDSSTTRITSPKGGTFKAITTPTTGAVQIKLPTFYNNTMLNMLVHIYDYGVVGDSGKSITLRFGGYNHDNGTAGVGRYTWVNCYAYQQSMKGIGPKTVRFGDDGTNATITIGETTDTYSFSPDVYVEYMDLGWNGADDAVWKSPLVITQVIALASNTKTTRVCSSGIGEVYANGGSQQNTTGLNFVNSSSIQVSVGAGAGTSAGNANITFTLIDSGTSIPDIKSALATHNTTFGTLNTSAATQNTTFGTLNTTFGTTNTALGAMNTSSDTQNTNINNANTYSSGLANAAANTVSVSANSGAQLTKKNLVFNNTATINVTVAVAADAANANIQFAIPPNVDLFSGTTDASYNIGRNSAEKIQFRVTDSVAYINHIQDETDTTDHSVNFQITSSSTGTNRFLFNKYVESSASFRAPIFYDTADLNYYVDPASKSNISSMNVWPGVTGPNTGIVINLGDITAGRTDQQGAIYLGRSGNTYLYFDGTRYRFGEAANIAPVYIPSGNLGLAISTPTSNLHVTGNANITTNIYTGNVFTSNSLSVNTTAGRANVHFSNTTIIDTPVQSISVANFSANENCAGKILVCNNATTANPVNVTFDVSATSGFAITLLRHGTGNTVIANTTALKKSNSSFFATSNIANRFCTATVIYTATNEIVVVGDIL